MAQVRFSLRGWPVNYRIPSEEADVNALRTVPGEQSNNPGHMLFQAGSGQPARLN